MAQKLTKMEIERVDLVDAGANERRFALFKRAAAVPLARTDMRHGTDADPSFLEKVGAAVAKVLGIGPDGEPIAKAVTFAQQIATQEVTAALEENFWVLSSSLWSAMYAVDENGADLSPEAKQALVAQNLDEFKAYLIAVMQAGIGKRAGAPGPGILIEGLVAKVGRKISAARLSRLKEAASALTDVLSEVEAGDDAAAEKRAAAREVDMTPDELTAAITKANEPLVARIEALEKGKPAAAGGESPAPDPAPEPDPDGGEAITLAGIAKAVGSIADRLEALEKKGATASHGQRTSADGQDGAPVTKSKWAGTF